MTPAIIAAYSLCMSIRQATVAFATNPPSYDFVYPTGYEGCPAIVAAYDRGAHTRRQQEIEQEKAETKRIYEEGLRDLDRGK